MITERLRHLEAHGLITRRVVKMRPVSVEYNLTPDGQSALKTLETLRDWFEAAD